MQIQDDYTLICRDLLKKETDFQIFKGLKVQLSTGEVGTIDGTFGQSGKIKIRVPGGHAKYDCSGMFAINTMIPSEQVMYH